MTPDQLSKIEARAKADSLYLNDRWVKDVLALVAAYRDLEQSLDQWQGSHENEVAKREKAEARVKEEEQLCDDWRRRARESHDKATALTERLKAAEAVCEWVHDYRSKQTGAAQVSPLDNLVAAWRKVKGEPLPVRQPKTTDRCPDCGAYVGPKQGG